MNREDIIRMAREAGCPVAGIGPMTFDDKQLVSMLERFAALVASAERERLTDSAMKAAEKAVDVAIALEREACAEIADKLPRTYRETKEAHERATLEPFHPSRFGFDFAEMRQAEVITHAIRARGQA